MTRLALAALATAAALTAYARFLQRSIQGDEQ